MWNPKKIGVIISLGVKWAGLELNQPFSTTTHGSPSY